LQRLECRRIPCKLQEVIVFVISEEVMGLVLDIETQKTTDSDLEVPVLARLFETTHY